MGHTEKQENGEDFDADWLEEFKKNSIFYKKGNYFVEKLSGGINDDSLVLLRNICKVNDEFFEYFYYSIENKNNFRLIMDDGFYIELLAYHGIITEILSKASPKNIQIKMR